MAPLFPRMPKWADKILYASIALTVAGAICVQLMEIPINWGFLRGLFIIVMSILIAASAVADVKAWRLEANASPRLN